MFALRTNDVSRRRRGSRLRGYVVKERASCNHVGSACRRHDPVWAGSSAVEKSQFRPAPLTPYRASTVLPSVYFVCASKYLAPHNFRYPAAGIRKKNRRPRNASSRGLLNQNRRTSVRNTSPAPPIVLHQGASSAATMPATSASSITPLALKSPGQRSATSVELARIAFTNN